MNKTNVLSSLLVLLFMVSCLTFFSVSATVNDPTGVYEEPTTQAVETEPTTEPPTTTVATTKATTKNTKPITTTALTTSKSTAKKTDAATAADPVYTSTTTTTTTTAKAVNNVETTVQAGTKETKEIHTTEKPTEPTTAAKNIVNYGNKYRPLKWLSLAVMIGCIAALIAVNVRYRKKYGKNPPKKPTNSRGGANKKPKLDTSARFTPPVKKADDKENLDKTAVVDLSSFSKKPKADDDYFGEKKRHEEDNLYNGKKSDDDDDLYI